ncbi:MAG: hypothetical protein AMK73_02155 [Planctomycetes bacterium SM23_32]|nr:MAG: hypothetical protein AMK73_02155 [Planctomycetes bacterium SM23_32]
MGDRRPAARHSVETDMAVMSLGDHLEELRARLIKCLLSVAAVFILCWIFRWQLIEVIKRPHVHAMGAYELEGVLNYRSYFEPIVAQLKACALVALILASPVVIYQIWAFVAPGLFPHERRKVLVLGAACVACFAAAICFGYFVFIPIALRYLLGFAGPGVRPVLMIGEYLTAFFLLTFALGVAFQTPVVVYYLVRWGVLDAASLRSKRKGVILAAFVLAAFITPPDPLTQIMMAVTLIVLYDLGGLLAAPSAATLRGFLKFTGIIAAVGGGLLAWHHLDPVAHLAVDGAGATVNERWLDAARTTKLTRGDVVVTADGGGAEMRMGRRARLDRAPVQSPMVRLASSTRVQVHDGRALSLRRGDILIAMPPEGYELTVHCGPATAVARPGAMAELRAPDPGTLVVTAMDGAVAVKEGNETTIISAGEAATFRRGGEPADLSEVERRWGSLAAPAGP